MNTKVLALPSHPIPLGSQLSCPVVSRGLHKEHVFKGSLDIGVEQLPNYQSNCQGAFGFSRGFEGKTMNLKVLRSKNPQPFEHTQPHNKEYAQNVIFLLEGLHVNVQEAHNS